MKQIDPTEYFTLKPIKAAKVSEVSEATASSNVPAEDRVNFHIGNPVQDKILSSAYLRMILGLDITRDDLNEDNLDTVLEELEWTQEEKVKLSFFLELIKKSAPYMPRGGFPKNNANFLAKYFHEWLGKNQQEPLSYDLGETSGKREIIFTSGGVFEALRLILHALSSYLVHGPANILLHNFSLPEHLSNFASLNFKTINDEEIHLPEEVNKIIASSSSVPTFLILGKITNEETRRELRRISLKHPLFFIEINDAANHLSLARESKMMNRVLRLLTPGIFSPSLTNLSTVFVAGNSDFLNVIETIQFQLKGTPSASEIEFLSFILKENLVGGQIALNKIEIDHSSENIHSNIINDYTFSSHVINFESNLNRLVEDKAKLFENLTSRIADKEISLTSRSEQISTLFAFDNFSEYSAKVLLNKFILNVDSETFTQELVNSFLFSFLRHHPEYEIKNTMVVSGSARTGLGILGFLCGIKEVVIPDLSWTYEHCFPSVSVVPLTDDFELDVEAIKKVVENKISADPHWKNYGAIVLNNPHNATGQEFACENLKKLIRWALERKIFIIDDLSYQNVAPHDSLKQIKSIRQLTDELHHAGHLDEEQSKYLITIHSLSKTDSFAGARLSVIDIRHEEINQKFKKINSTIRPNIAAIFLAYLFYRCRIETANAYWRLRNKIFEDRMYSLMEAVDILPKARNTFDIHIKPPKGSMYPQMIIDRLPSGLSLDWLASGLARQGIGLVSLATFARTEKGFETGRKTFRLTLGGTDNAEILLKKTRRVLIDLNRMIAEEAANYNRKQFIVKTQSFKNTITKEHHSSKWNEIENNILSACSKNAKKNFINHLGDSFYNEYIQSFEKEFLPDRISAFKKRFEERQMNADMLMQSALSDTGKSLSAQLEYEFYKDNLEEREKRFKQRLYDRTVHPTQMYSLKAELLFEKIIEQIIKNESVPKSIFDKAAEELTKEYLGLNVAIESSMESSELLLDLNSIIAAENYSMLHSDFSFKPLLSFWGDWDGSNRPSGQGHSLVAAVIIENVARQTKLLQLLLKSDKSIKIDSNLLIEIEKIPERNLRFSKLLNEITTLTHQLEKRFKGILPFNIKAGKMRRLGMNLRIAQDPLTSLWHHNDRLERKMLDLRAQRRKTLEYYFSLNKQLRKTLYGLIPSIQKNLENSDLLLEASMFRDLLKRFVITPRIHQKLITAQDQFAIDTTVHNINEINEISGKYGNPGIVLALQVSMSTKPEALISLDRKIRAQREHILREQFSTELPSVWSIPLFEDIDSVRNIKNYLNKVWEYSLQSRRINQETNERFCEIINEIFIAGSDLSQQVGQAAGLNLYKEGKYELCTWLAEKGLIGKVRMKMGSGEPMQRQGGYYSDVVGKPAFIKSGDSTKRFSNYLKESAKKSTEYAATPLLGVFAGGDLRTFQSSISEKLRYISVKDFSQLLYHIKESQKFYETEIVRAGEPLVETRLQFRTRGLKELERLTVGRKDDLFNEFLLTHTENFRQILYGREEDVVGIHIISYFISRTTPPLRDRPTVRPGHGVGGSAGQKILEKISETIPFSKYGSLLRAISHNQSQTYVLGINQLTTGLFRALDSFAQKISDRGSSTLIEDRILPNLPVYEILHSLRIFQDSDLIYLNKIEKAFPAGNSAFLALREDVDAQNKYLILFQRELLRRHGLNVSDFFEEDKFISDLLPTLRPDLAILLQLDLFNTSEEKFLASINGNVSDVWFSEIKKLLVIPGEIKSWRAKMWNLLEQPVSQRVSSFVELAIALYSLSSNLQTKELPFAPKKIKVSSDISNYFKASSDDNMHQFLAAAFEYLSTVSEGMVEVPINIIRALKEVERIMKIEEQALSPKEQDMLRFYLLQIARLTGENG